MCWFDTDVLHRRATCAPARAERASTKQTAACARGNTAHLLKRPRAQHVLLVAQLSRMDGQPAQDLDVDAEILRSAGDEIGGSLPRETEVLRAAGKGHGRVQPWGRHTAPPRPCTLFPRRPTHTLLVPVRSPLIQNVCPARPIPNHGSKVGTPSRHTNARRAVASYLTPTPPTPLRSPVRAKVCPHPCSTTKSTRAPQAPTKQRLIPKSEPRGKVWRESQPIEPGLHWPSGERHPLSLAGRPPEAPT